MMDNLIWWCERPIKFSFRVWPFSNLFIVFHSSWWEWEIYEVLVYGYFLSLCIVLLLFFVFLLIREWFKLIGMGDLLLLLIVPYFVLSFLCGVNVCERPIKSFFLFSLCCVVLVIFAVFVYGILKWMSWVISVFLRKINNILLLAWKIILDRRTSPTSDCLYQTKN